MSQETIKTYQGSSIGASQCLVTLESFIGDMENAELADDSTVDASDAVTAINGLIWEIERREAEVERMRELVQLALRGLHNDFEPDNQSSVYNRIKAALATQQSEVVAEKP